MYVPPDDESRHYVFNDDTGFVEAGSAGASGNYDLLFEALANPHPKSVLRQETVLDDRPPGCRRNFVLIGRVNRDVASSESTPG